MPEKMRCIASVSVGLGEAWVLTERGYRVKVLLRFAGHGASVVDAQAGNAPDGSGGVGGAARVFPGGHAAIDAGLLSQSESCAGYASASQSETDSG